MYPDIQLAFRFAKRYLSRINSSAHPSKMENAFSNILKRYHVDIHIQLNGFLTNNHADSSACYTCTKISDVIAAILHYYMVNDFKLIKCEHCNRYFAASTRKAKYCPRLSPYIDAFSQKPVKARRKCEQTVRNAMQQLSRKRYRFEPEPTDKEYGEFAQACEEYVNLLNQKHSIANLTAYNEYLESRKRRRKKENR